MNEPDMIVVHPSDPSTRMLGLLYEGIDGVTVFNSWKQRDEILAAIAAAPGGVEPRRGRRLRVQQTVLPKVY